MFHSIENLSNLRMKMITDLSISGRKKEKLKLREKQD
jgi:hypothetical protein